MSITLSDNSDQDFIKGYTKDGFYHTFDMHLWTFSISSESKILNENVKIPENKSLCVKALSQKYSENTEYLPVNVDQTFPNLVVYEFENCHIKKIGYANLKNLKNLQLINLESNQISSITSSAFNDTPILKYLNLGNNQLTYIDENIFKQLKNLQSLFLQNNKITFISKFAFRYLSDLRKISLNDNLLQTLEDQHFRNNKKLEKIWLKNNKIQYLSPTMFNGKMNMELVDLKNNTCIDGEFCIARNEDENDRKYPEFVFSGVWYITNSCKFSFENMIDKIINDC